MVSFVHYNMSRYKFPSVFDGFKAGGADRIQRKDRSPHVLIGKMQRIYGGQARGINLNNLSRDRFVGCTVGDSSLDNDMPHLPWINPQTVELMQTEWHLTFAR